MSDLTELFDRLEERSPTATRLLRYRRPSQENAVVRARRTAGNGSKRTTEKDMVVSKIVTLAGCRS